MRRARALRSLLGFLLVTSIIFVSCSSQTPTLSGPEACIAAGGKCVLGLTMNCAKFGDQDCDPGQHPGGAVCCLEERGLDASTDAGDDVADAAVFCSTLPAPDFAPATLNDVPFAAWCASNPGRVSEWTCGGVVAVTIGVGVDCHEQYFFDVTSKKLVALVQGCNVGNGICVAGNPDFAPPNDCLGGNVAVQVVDVCVEGGLTTMAPDGAGGPCTDNSQCPAGYRCGYFTNSGCGATAQCFYGDFFNNPTCKHEMRCACDGSVTEGCVGPWGGFTLKPVSTRESGPCTE